MNKKDLAIGIFKHPVIQEIIESKVFETSVVNQLIVEILKPVMTVNELIAWWNGTDNKTRESLFKFAKERGDDFIHPKTSLESINDNLRSEDESSREWAVKQLLNLRTVYNELKSIQESEDAFIKAIKDYKTQLAFLQWMKASEILKEQEGPSDEEVEAWQKQMISRDKDKFERVIKAFYTLDADYRKLIKDFLNVADNRNKFVDHYFPKKAEEPKPEKPSEEPEELPDEFKKEIAAKFEALKQPRERFTKFFLRVPFLYQQQEILMKLVDALDEIQKDTVALSRQEIKEEKEVKLDDKMTRRLRSDLRYVENKIRSINAGLTNFIENIGTKRTAPEEKKALVEDIMDLQKYISEVYDYSFDIGKTLKEQDEGLSRDQIIDIVEDTYDEVNAILKSIDLEMAEGQDFRKINAFIDQIRDNVEKVKPFFPKTAKFQPTAEKGSKEALQDFQKAITAFRADYLIDTYNDLKDGITSERQLATIQSALYNLSEKIEKLLGVESKISKKEMEVPSDMESLTDTPDPRLSDVIPVDVEEVPQEPTPEPEERVPTRFETEMEAEQEFRRLDQRQKTSVLNFMNIYSDIVNKVEEQSVISMKAIRDAGQKLAKSLDVDPNVLSRVFQKMGKEDSVEFVKTILSKPEIKSSIVKVLKGKKEPTPMDEKEKFISSFGVSEVDFPGYDWNAIIVDENWNPKGAVVIRKTKEPCLPNTYEVGYVAVAEDLSGKGFGSYLYDLAASKAQELGGKDAGITSDRTGSSTQMAKGIWNRISEKYTAKETEQGNKKFDYDEKTPDQQDDCNRPPGGNPATDYSWIVPDNLKSRALKIFNLQKQNISEENRPDDFETRIESFWEKEYGRGKESGIVETLESKLSSIISKILREEYGEEKFHN
jgi:hypothetical protein